jgi:hypothetical protein
MPEQERFANATRDFAALKKNLQQAAVPKK